jgi:DNA transformation protein and related proteins
MLNLTPVRNASGGNKLMRSDCPSRTPLLTQSCASSASCSFPTNKPRSGSGARAREQLAPLGQIAMRRMFGKTGVFCDGVMFGMVTEDTLYLRVDDHNRATFKKAESFPPLSYEKKGSTIDLSFWRAPERLLDEPDELVTRAREALAAARRVAGQRTMPRRKPKPQPT